MRQKGKKKNVLWLTSHKDHKNELWILLLCHCAIRTPEDRCYCAPSEILIHWEWVLVIGKGKQLKGLKLLLIGLLSYLIVYLPLCKASMSAQLPLYVCRYHTRNLLGFTEEGSTLVCGWCQIGKHENFFIPLILEPILLFSVGCNFFLPWWGFLRHKLLIFHPHYTLEIT